MEKQTMGKFIAALRKAKGMTQRELAEKLGVTDKSVSKWECDEGFPDLSLIPVIAEIFDVTSDEILKGCRIIKEGAVFSADTAKMGKQVNRLIQKTLTSFKNLSILAILLGVIGAVFLAVPLIIFSSAGYMDSKIFYLCVIFYVVFTIACIVLETIFMNSSKTALYDPDIAEEYDAPLLAATKYIEDLSFCVITAAVLILIAGLPALFSNIPPYVLLLIALPMYIISLIVKTVVATKKYYDIKQEEEVKKQLRKLANICSVVVTVFLLAVIVLYSIASDPSASVPASFFSVLCYLIVNGTGVLYLLQRKKLLKPYSKLKKEN